MTQSNAMPVDPVPAAADVRGDVRLIDLLTVLVRQWRVVAGFLVGSLILAVAILLLLPSLYQAEAVLVPAPDDSNAGFLLPADLLPPGLLAGAGSGGKNEQLIETILKSHSLPDSIIRFVAGDGAPARLEQVRRVVYERSSVQKRDDGSIRVKVQAPEPRLAADVANAYPIVINRIFVDLQAQAARARQQFLERQLAEVGEQLAQSEQRMLQFQQHSDAPEVTSQARQTIEVAATLQQQILEKEVALQQMKRTATPDNPLVRAAASEIASLRGQLQRLIRGRGEGVLTPLDRSAGLQVDFVRISREYLKNEQVYKSLTAALAEAQIAARNTLPVVSVLDAPTVPRAHHPRPVPLALALAVLFGLFGGAMVAFAAEYARRVRGEPDGAQLRAAWRVLKQDLRISSKPASASASR